MGYWPKRMKKRRNSWVTNVGRKLILLGFEGSHRIVYGNTPRMVQQWRMTKMYYIERGNEGSENGYSTTSVLLKMARRMEIL